VPTFDRRISADDGSAGFSAHVTVQEDHARLVHLVGELDMATGDMAERAVQFCGDVAVVVDLTDLTFMDWRGYRRLLVARRSLLQRGGSLTLCNVVGQPANALAIFTRLLADAVHG